MKKAGLTMSHVLSEENQRPEVVTPSVATHHLERTATMSNINDFNKKEKSGQQYDQKPKSPASPGGHSTKPSSAERIKQSATPENQRPIKMVRDVVADEPRGRTPHPLPVEQRDADMPAAAADDDDDACVSDNGSSGADSVVAPVPEPAPDPFDLSIMRITPGIINVSVKKTITTAPVRKPNRQEFCRVRRGEEWRANLLIAEDNESREAYLVSPSLHDTPGLNRAMVSLRTAINRRGDVFLWPVKLPQPNQRPNRWNDSALEAAAIAESNWVRIESNIAANCYETFVAVSVIPEPEWPDLTFQELIRIAFKYHLINDPNHPFLRKLRGEGLHD